MIYFIDMADYWKDYMKKKELPKKIKKSHEEAKPSILPVPESWLTLFIEEMEKEKGFYNKKNIILKPSID